MVTREEAIVLLSIPVSAVMLLILSQDEPLASTSNVNLSSTGQKEANFLRYNQDQIYGNLLAAEVHFRKLTSKGADQNFNQCAVKHLSLSANDSDEAVSHSVAVGEQKDSVKYAELRDKITDLQHDVQDGKVKPLDGIERVRELKHEFEAFNPSFDVSKCKACQVE